MRIAIASRALFFVLTTFVVLVDSASALDLNTYRTANKRPALRVDSTLSMMAAGHARDMARRGMLDHAGFMTQRGPFGARAENVAVGCPDEACAIRAWINSAPHRVNMLRRDVTSYGLASAAAPNGRRYWALELGN